MPTPPQPSDRHATPSILPLCRTARAETHILSIDLERKGAKPLLVCFSHLRWDFVWQRPQHLLSRATRDFDVIFIEEPVAEGPGSARLSVSNRAPGLHIAVPHLPPGLPDGEIVECLRTLVASLLDEARGRRVVFWYYTPMAVPFTRDLKRTATLYDNMDELSAFRGASPGLLAQEEALLCDADVVFTGGISLYEAKQGRHPNVHAFPSSIDAGHFGRARQLQRQRASSGPVTLGFFGVVDERLDLELLARLADLRPDWQIEMIGPVVKIDPESLPQRPNLIWRGSCPYADLPECLANWTIGIMPFAINEATRFISPTKTPEFLAAGLTVVSTPIIDVVRSYGQRGLVEIAATPGLFVAAVERLLARPRGPWLAEVDRHLATTSWDATWAGMRALILDAVASRKAQLADPAPRRGRERRAAAAISRLEAL